MADEAVPAGGEHEDGEKEEEYVFIDVEARAHVERVKAEMDSADRDAPFSQINCSTVRGLEERMGLLLLARGSLYVVDNYQLNEENEIVEVNVPTSNFNVQVREGNVLRGGVSSAPKRVSHRKRRVRYDDIFDVQRRRFLFREVGLWDSGQQRR